MYLLRGGASTEDPRLDRVYPGVERHLPSLRFLTADLTVDKAPRSYTWNFRGYDPKLNQGNEGACVGFGWGNELACFPAVVIGIDNGYCHDQIYWPAQRRDQWPGGSYPGASPFYEGSSVLAGAEVVHEELRLIGGYDWSLNLNDLILAVGYLGPAVLGIDWLTGMFHPDSNGFIHATGQVEGGHCILARAVSLKKRAFLLRNSWGPNWGLNGDCWISFDDLGPRIEAQGEAAVPRQRVAKAA